MPRNLMRNLKFRCYVWGRDSDWEAICTDLDIAAQGRTLETTKDLLDEAISGYLDEVEELPVSEQYAFFNRRAPLLLRIRLRVNYYFFQILKQFRELPSSNFQSHFFPFQTIS